MADISSITLPGGGTYDLKDKNAVPKYGMGKNLLDNWYFNVNSRNLTTASGQPAQYILDRWFGSYGSGGFSYTINSSGLTVGPTKTSSYAFLSQNLSAESVSLINGKKLKASLLLQDGTMIYATTVITRTNGTEQYLYNTTALKIYMDTNNKFVLRVTASTALRAIKLELGTEQTLAHQEGSAWVINEIPDYEYELYRCITSTADPSDTYANKSLATEQQLAYVETGTTASRTYAVGEYFCWNGLLYRVTSAISSSQPFNPGSNCEQVTAGGLNELKPINGSGNGQAYTKFPDGTLIIRGSNSSYINANSDLDKEYTFEVPFVSAPSVMAQLAINPNDASATRNGLIFASASLTKCNIKVRNQYNYQAPFWWGWVAFGRWK